MILFGEAEQNYTFESTKNRVVFPRFYVNSKMII